MVELLIVEDEEEILDLLLIFMGDLRVSVDGVSRTVRVTPARNGKEALDLISKNWYDAILSDIHMPVMDGLDLLANLRGLGKEIPLVFLTGFGDKEHAVRALRLGCFDFLEKPFDVGRLRDVVHRATEVGFRGRALEQALELKLLPFAHLPVDRYRQLRLVFRSMLIAEQHGAKIEAAKLPAELPAELPQTSLQSLLGQPAARTPVRSKRPAVKPKSKKKSVKRAA
jgi:YesN/AraC family two-component response regulator